MIWYLLIYMLGSDGQMHLDSVQPAGNYQLCMSMRQGLDPGLGKEGTTRCVREPKTHVPVQE